MSFLLRLTCSLQLTCKFIAHNIRRATLINLLGLAGASNATGDDQKKLDVLGNQIFIDCMKNCGKVAVIVSEEEEDVIIVKTKGARYAVACDPIDGILPQFLSNLGSSNLDAGVSVGTIFGIYKIPDSSLENPSVKDVLRPGTEMLVAGYCMYAASANLVLTTGTGNGVNGFTLDNALGEFILTHPNVYSLMAHLTIDANPQETRNLLRQRGKRNVLGRTNNRILQLRQIPQIWETI